MAKQFQNVRGMPDVLPEDQVGYRYAITTFRQLADAAGYDVIDTPTLEDKAVFVRGVGDDTDIVDKEMYVLKDRSDNDLALRPEPTAGIVRAYIQHGMASLPQPVRLQTSGPMFRYDRPQAGRQRQFTQVDVEVIGEAAPSIDAQIITLALRYYRTLGLRRVSLQINSIGDKVCRPKYQKALVEYFTEHKKDLCEDCQKRLKKNPLRILDCKDKGCRKLVAGAPQTLNHLCEACHQHFTGVLEYLDNLEIAYELNPQLVRGLDYYTRTVFEFYGEREGAQSSLGGGGRYDELVQLLGGRPTPAAGFGIGVERVLIELKGEGIEIPEPQPVQVYVASLGEPARLSAFALIERLLDAGVGVVGAVDKDGIGGQLERANKLDVPYAIIIGQKEVKEETVILRDMRSGAQEMLPLGTIAAELQQRFSS
ncbi:MAG TPA: histidine--tRNA ligase [Candidatus Saccharimonadales bacterium]|nr:histidine--tRNA ligase [Candidatus Saccharimonadales bacterium]